jgi:hypothetical protein
MSSKKITFKFFVAFFLITAFNSNAQDATTKQQAPYKVNVLSDSIFVVEFSSDKIISNLLITVFDSKGNLTFMDCQYNFSGPYKKNIPFNKSIKNDYTLKIISDKEVFDKRMGTD